MQAELHCGSQYDFSAHLMDSGSDDLMPVLVPSVGWTHFNTVDELCSKYIHMLQCKQCWNQSSMQWQS